MAEYTGIKQQLTLLARQTRAALKAAKKLSQTLVTQTKRANRELVAARKAADKAAELANRTGYKKDAKAARTALELAQQAQESLRLLKARQRKLPRRLRQLQKELRMAEAAVFAATNFEVEFSVDGVSRCIKIAPAALGRVLPSSDGATSIEALMPGGQGAGDLNTFLGLASSPPRYFGVIRELPAGAQTLDDLVSTINGALSMAAQDLTLIAIYTGCNEPPSTNSTDPETDQD